MPRFLLTALSAPFFLLSPLSGQETARPEPLAITHVTVVDVRDGQILPDRTVVVRGDRVAAVGPSSDVLVPEDARTVDARGSYLIPGLWDMHVHAVFDPALADRLLLLMVANGVTGIRDMGGVLDVLVDVRDRIHAGDAVAPRIVAAGPILDGPGAPHPEVSWILETPEEGRAAVDSLAGTGVDFVKVYTTLAPEVFYAVVERAADRGLPVAGHVPGELSPIEGAEAGMKSIEHLRSELDLYCDPDDPASCEEPFSVFRRNDTWHVPTLTVRRHRAFLDDSAALYHEHLRYAPESLMSEWRGIRRARLDRGDDYFRSTRERHRKELRLTGLLDSAGLPILAGSDAGVLFSLHGFSLHRELELLVQAGLTELEALQAATLAPARFLGATDSLGTVEEGKLADLVLIEADPLEDIRNTRRIQAVILDGRLFERSRIEAMLQAPHEPPGRASGQQHETRSDPPDHPLIVAARSGNVAEVERLLASGVDPEVRPEHGLTPLMWAAGRGDVRMARALLEAGADPAYGYDRDWTPLVMAARQGALEVVRVLADRLPAREVTRRLTDALTAAARMGHPRTAAHLVARGADAGGRGPDGSPPLALAARYGHPATVDRLLASGAPVDGRDEEGRTALTWASWQGSEEIARRLVEAGADPTVEDYRGWSALYGAPSWAQALEEMRDAWHREEEVGHHACPVDVSGGWLRTVGEGDTLEAVAARMQERRPVGTPARVVPLTSRTDSPPAFAAEVAALEPDPAAVDLWRVTLRPSDPPADWSEGEGPGGAFVEALILWGARAGSPRAVDPSSPRALPWGVVPETISAAFDLDGDGAPELLALGTCCSDTTEAQDAAICEYMCRALLVRGDEGWRLCQWQTPA